MGYIPTMPYTRSIPAAIITGLFSLVLLARAQEPAPPQVPAPAPAPTPVPPGAPTAEQYLDDATIKVRLMERIAASIEQKVEMLNQNFKLVGNYYKDTGYRMRLQLKLEGLGDTGSTMLQVCDGKILWDYQQVLKMQSYRKREITPILKKLEDPILDEFFRGAIISNLGFGGPEAMMTGLKKAVNFDQTSIDKLDVDGTILDVVIIGGKWRDRTGLMGPNDRPLAPTAPLPPYVPSNVRMYLGINGWPYKIEMIGEASSILLEDTRAIDPSSGRPVGQPRKPPKVDPSKVTLNYRLLPISEISEALFVFSAPSDVAATNVKDETEEFLAMLDQYIQSETNRKKAEAAKAEGESLPPIRLPKDPATDAPGAIPTPEPTAPPK